MEQVDARLLRRARSGDRTALEELVRTTIGGVRLFLLSVSPPGAPVDDLVQETYLTAYTRLADFDPSGEGTFLSWICGIGRNLLRRELRSRAREAHARDALGRREARDERSPWAEAGRWEETIETPAKLVSERAARLRRCLQRLPAGQRELVSLRYGRGLPYDQIARTLRRSAGWARTTLFRARQLLRRCVERAEVSRA